MCELIRPGRQEDTSCSGVSWLGGPVLPEQLSMTLLLLWRRDTRQSQLKEDECVLVHGLGVEGVMGAER